MKIIRLSTFLDFGGIETKMINLSTAIDSNNEWIFCAIGKGGMAEKSIFLNKKKVICFNLPYKIPSPITIYKLFVYLKKEKPQVLHTSGAEANFHGVIAAKLAHVPVIVAEEIGIPTQSKLAKRIFKMVYQFSDYVIGESEIVVDNLKKSYGIANEKLKVVSNFTVFSEELPKPVNVDPRCFKIITVSRLEPVKNIEGIIRTINLLKKEKYNVKYTIVGDGILKENIINLIKELDLENEIEMVGYKSTPAAYLLASDLYLLNSFSEGFSNSLLEAMYLRIPSLTTNVGAADEMIDDGINGWIVEKDNEVKLFQKIKTIIQMNKESRAIVGEKAFEKVVNYYSLETHLSNVLKLYHQKND